MGKQQPDQRRRRNPASAQNGKLGGRPITNFLVRKGNTVRVRYGRTDDDMAVANGQIIEVRRGLAHIALADGMEILIKL